MWEKIGKKKSAPLRRPLVHETMKDRGLVRRLGVQKFGADNFFGAQRAQFIHPRLHKGGHRARAARGNDDHVRINRLRRGVFPQARMAQSRVFAEIRLDEHLPVTVGRQPVPEVFRALQRVFIFTQKKDLKRVRIGRAFGFHFLYSLSFGHLNSI